MLGARREGAFAVQVDVRKKVLWGQWAECAMAGARNSRGRCGRTVVTTRGQLPLLLTASDLDSGGLVGCCQVGALGVCARAVTMRHSASQPRDGHNIAKDDNGQPYPLLTTTGENENRPSAQTACLQPRATGPLRFPSPPLRRHSARSGPTTTVRCRPFTTTITTTIDRRHAPHPRLPRRLLFLVPQFTSITDLHPRPLPHRGHKHKRRGNARGRMTTRPMRKGPTHLSKSSFFFCILSRSLFFFLSLHHCI